MKEILKERGLQLRRRRIEKGLETQVIRVFNPFSMVYDGEVALVVHVLDVSKSIGL